MGSEKHFDIWVEKYRPSKFDGYVFKDENMKGQFEYWVRNEENKKIPIPHLLLAGSPGTGKTTLARILLNELGVHKGDILEINASRENQIDVVREKIVNFAQTYPMGDYKVIFMDEADNFSQAAQKILRAEIEKYSDSVRFVLTCNYPQRIMPALHSRFQMFMFNELDLESWVGRIVEILNNEGVKFDVEHMDDFINASYPDLRKCINLLDQHTRNKVLHSLTERSDNNLDYVVDLERLIKNKNIDSIRKLVSSQLTSNEDYDALYKWMYSNVEIFGSEQITIMNSIIIISKGLRNHAVVADPEINMCATIMELMLQMK